MPPHIRFQIGTPECLPQLLPLFRAYQAHYQQLTSASEEKTKSFLAELLSHPKQGFVLLAIVDGQLIGFATGFFTISGVIAERLLHVGDLYVEPAFRRQQIGTALMMRVVDEARARGIPFVRWLSLSSNSTLNAWYESLGAQANEFKLFLRPTHAPANMPNAAPRISATESKGETSTARD
jgi:GNAT superfamily N-acetyltransferase